MEGEHFKGSLGRAWLAGLFDAEGSVYNWAQRTRSGSPPQLRRQIEISQGAGNVSVLHDVLRVLDGRGHIRGPVRGYLYYWYLARQELIDQLGDELFPWLSEQKRKQYLDAARFVGRPLPTAEPWSPKGFPDPHELAWAAGFFEGEGTIAINHGYGRLSLPQAASDGLPQVLRRFQSAVGGAGWIIGPITLKNPWSKLPQYIWGSSRFEHVQAVVAMLWPWLGPRRRGEARSVLTAATKRLRSRNVQAPRPL